MSKILILLEGEKLDKNIIENLKDIHKFNDNIEVIIYKTNIHILYDHIKNEYGTTWPVKIIPLLRKRIQNFNLQDSDIGQIYLFFDSDMQAPQANNERLEEMFKYFNDETKNGKLYISYPMVEAFFDIDFEQEEYYKNKEIMGTDYVNYKSDKNVKVNILKQQDILKDKNKIDIIFKQNIKKLNYIINTDFSFLDYESYIDISEIDIFNSQVKRYGDLKTKISVLSPFPKFFIDYFGKPLYEELTKTNNTI
ncbi:hypothetical protein LDK30_00420 [Fusobacterium polymorphum]|uniref:Uncharacterized protein n=1 Tax=Fusobacterium nucleatum subsp. polymorphum TaxID=76857 RepID=A0A2C6C923_FUSNP|nr:hypothetical protein [Fusobacterium polymorphum]PHI12881.1 hypothetical protein CBG59_03515 [Fusobacterium polymorphum]